MSETDTNTNAKKLVWDKPGEHWYELGVSKGVLYKKNAGTYGAGVAWNGLTTVTESPDGAEPTDLWADNRKYATLRSAENLNGTIEAYTYPDEWAECDGSAQPVPGVYLGQQGRKAFGLCYRTEKGNDEDSTIDDGYKLHLLYNATASPSERAYATINDSPDANTFSWEFQTTPVEVEGFKPTACITIDSNTVDADALADLEEILYGKDPVIGESGTVTTQGVAPRLPEPDEVLQILGYTAAD